MKLAIIIPAYNEEKVIGAVLKAIPKKLDGINQIETIVIDDGSVDQTYAIAKENSSYAIRHMINLGVGSATTTGLEIAKKIGTDIVITLDADGQHNPQNILSLISPIIHNEADIVIGSRMFDYQGMPILKVVGNWLMNLITLLVFQKWVSDSQSGMKAISKKAIEKIKLTSTGYEICSEVIGEAKRNNLNLIEIPIETIYTDYSKVKGQNILNAINILTKIIYIRLAGQK